MGLVHPAVQRFGPVAAAVHRLGQHVDLGACAAEHEGGLRRLDVEDPTERGGLVGALDDVRPLRDQRRAVGAGRSAHRDAYRVGQETPGDAGDTWRHRGREQHGLALGRQVTEDRLDVLGEAHVEHLVGLVEDHGANAGDVERPATEVVDDPPGGTDDHVDAAFERLQLTVDRLPAVHRDDLDPEPAPVLEDRLGHLHRQLACRDEHEGGSQRSPAVDLQRVQQGQGEGGGLARTGRRLTDEVATLDEVRNRLALHRRRLLVAEFGQGIEQFSA